MKTQKAKGIRRSGAGGLFANRLNSSAGCGRPSRERIHPYGRCGGLAGGLFPSGDSRARPGGWEGQQTSLFAALAVLAFFLPALRAAAWPPELPTPVTYPLSIFPYYYDESHHAGLVQACQLINPGAVIQAVSRKDGRAYSSNYGMCLTISDTGSAATYDFFATVPPLGRYQGTAASYGGNPHYVIPTTSEKLGFQLPALYIESLSPSPNGYNGAVGATLSVLNHSGDGAGYIKNILALASKNKALKFTVSYLEGCNLFGRPPDTALFENMQTAGSDILSIHWRQSTSTPYPYQRKLGEISPIGPIQVSVYIDGYSTDTITINSENLKAYLWEALLRPLADRPDADRPVGYEFRQVEDWTTGTLTETPTSTPAPSDTNSATPTLTMSPTPETTVTPNTPTLTLTLTLSPTSSLVPTNTAGPSQTIQPSTSPTIGPTATAISSPTAIISPSATPLSSILIISQAILMGSGDAVDMNHDGYVDIADLLTILNHPSGLAFAQKKAADFDNKSYRLAAIQETGDVLK